MTQKRRCRSCQGALLIAVTLITILFVRTSANAQVWTVIASDPKGDGKDSSLPDAAQLAYRYDKQQDVLWFRLAVYGKPNAQAFGVNIAFDTGGAETSKINWWGSNTAFRFDKLLMAWVTRGSNGYEGMIGIGDATGAKSKVLNNLKQNNLQIKVDDEAILIGVKRTDVTDRLQMKLVASVGSNQVWNDDVPNVGSAAIDLAAARPTRGLLEIDVSRNNLIFPAGYKVLSDKQAPVIKKQGSGKQPLILIPGLYSGAKSFDNFIARNQSQYKIFLLWPPGLNGSPARNMPARDTSFSQLSWTRHLERDVLDLIRKEKLIKPIIVAERQPGAQAAMELATEHPESIGGVVLVATNLVQFFGSPKDPTRRDPIAFPDRVSLVDEGWAARWFKYVTPETWRSGDLSPALLSRDPSRGQTAWDELEAAPLEVKIRYLCEFWASDVTRSFDKLQVPVLALIPTFDGKFLVDPMNGFAKTAFIDSWDRLVPKHRKIELVKIPNAWMLLLDDEPEQADDEIRKFVSTIK